jgi:acetolactate synthase small subunit
MDRIQQLAQIVEVQQMQIEYWKGVTVALSLVVRAQSEKLSREEIGALVAKIEASVQDMSLTDGEIETVKATLRSLLRVP